MSNRLYWIFACLGLMTVSASFLMGFNHSPAAPARNYVFNILLYAVFIVVHIAMTVPAFKQALFGSPEGTSTERRVYILISVVTWVLVYALHKPVPGFAFVPPFWLQYVGVCAFLLGVFAFFEFATFESLDSLLGVPGAEMSHTVGSETPLMTEGSYAQVRHPMYRAAVCFALASLLIHPHAGQLLFVAMVGASFLGFIPFEERQLLKARGEQYQAYRGRTPWRVFRGVW